MKKNALMMLFALFMVYVPEAFAIQSYGGITFEPPQEWTVDSSADQISMYPSEDQSPMTDGVTISISRLPDKMPKDIAKVWDQMEANYKALGITDVEVLEKQDGSLAGKPVKIVLYTEQELGMKERSTVRVMYLSVHEGAPVLEIRYSAAKSAYERYWPEALKVISSIRLK